VLAQQSNVTVFLTREIQELISRLESNIFHFQERQDFLLNVSQHARKTRTKRNNNKENNNKKKTKRHKKIMTRKDEQKIS